MDQPDFTAATEAALSHAAEICGARGVRLTTLRREVLGLILQKGAPVGAYELLDGLRGRRGAAAPPTIYRALEFLQEQGLIHRLERLSAYIGCLDHAHGSAHSAGHSHAGDHAAQFLICRGCGQVAEIEDAALSAALKAAAARLGFALGGATIEAEGLCAACRAVDQSAMTGGGTPEV